MTWLLRGRWKWVSCHNHHHPSPLTCSNSVFSKSAHGCSSAASTNISGICYLALAFWEWPVNHCLNVKGGYIWIIMWFSYLFQCSRFMFVWCHFTGVNKLRTWSLLNSSLADPPLLIYCQKSLGNQTGDLNDNTGTSSLCFILIVDTLMWRTFVWQSPFLPDPVGALMWNTELIQVPGVLHYYSPTRATITN